MRMAYFLGTYPQASETFISREIAGLRARGHTVDIFSLFAPPTGREAGVMYGWPDQASRLKHRVMPRQEERHLASLWKKYLAVEHYQLAVAHFASLPSTLALHAVGPVPLVMSVHARDLYVEAEHLPEKMTRAAAVVTCTKANADYLRQTFPQHGAKIHAIYHGLPAHWMDTPPRDHVYLSTEPLHLLAVGRFVDKKGFAVLLQAMAKCDFPITLLLVGDGPLRGTLVKLRDSLGLTTIVDFPGWLSETELRAAYAHADVLCCPSIIAHDGDRDGLPNVLVEGMSCGLPVVASRLSGIPEAVQDGVNGLLLPPGDIDALYQALWRCTNYPLLQSFREVAGPLARRHFDGQYWLNEFERVVQSCARRILDA